MTYRAERNAADLAEAKALVRFLEQMQEINWSEIPVGTEIYIGFEEPIESGDLGNIHKKTVMFLGLDRDGRIVYELPESCPARKYGETKGQVYYALLSSDMEETPDGR